MYYVNARSLKISIVRVILCFMGGEAAGERCSIRKIRVKFGITDFHETLSRDFQFRENCRRERRTSFWVSIKLHLYINCATVRHSHSKERLD
jgi:hypothetical protein